MNTPFPKASKPFNFHPKIPEILITGKYFNL